MKIKFRAECLQDILNLLEQLSHKQYEEFKIKSLNTFGDVECVLKLRGETTRENVLEAMSNVQDSHVMIQTCEKIDEYTGERDYDRK